MQESPEIHATQPAVPVPRGLTLVLGGARSGKSAFAERLCERAVRPVYIATGVAFDAEMRLRIAEHRARRGEHWQTVDAPLELAPAIRTVRDPGAAILVDCLGVWLGNLMHEQRDVDAEREALLDALRAAVAPVVMVSSEVGMSIVPENAMARAFRDHAGRMHQCIGDLCARVYLVVAGQPLAIKEPTS